MKRILAILMIFTLLLTACGQTASSESSGEAQNQSEVQTAENNAERVLNDYLVHVVYPEEVPYPSYEDYVDYNEYEAAMEQWMIQHQAKVDAQIPAEELSSYYNQVLSTLLSAKEDSENIVVSPLNIFLALSLLAESTDSETRDEILSVLGTEDLSTLRSLVKGLWESNYHDDGSVTSLLSNSLWIDNDLITKEAWLQTLKEHYVASVYSGDMGSVEMDEALQTWLNDNTGHLLEDAVENVTLDPSTLLALASTLYFNARWADEFQKEGTTEEIFHGTNGDETCQMMHRSGSGNYVYGSHFSALEKALTNAGSMIFLLPDEGFTPEDLLQDEEVMNYIIRSEASVAYSYINLSLPRFDVSSDLKLDDTLKQLGIQEIFTETADFTPVTDDALMLSSMKHAARIKVDEEGVEAAAFTVALMAGGGMPGDSVDFTLDRPFLFVMKGLDGNILFAGIVNHM